MPTDNKALREKLGVTTSEALDDWFNLLLYGDPGIGKTLITATAHLHEMTTPIVIFDIEGGMKTIKQKWPKEVNSGKGIDIVPIRSMKEFQQKLNGLYDMNNGYYKTFGLDNLTELQKLDMKDIMDAAYNKNPDKVDKDVPSQREWGITLNHMRNIVRAIRDMPMNTIITAHAYYEVQEGESITRIYPDISGKGRIQIPGFCDIVGYYFMARNGNDLVRRMQFAKTARVIAKDRTDTLGDFVDNPTIPVLWDIINGKVKIKEAA